MNNKYSKIKILTLIVAGAFVSPCMAYSQEDINNATLDQMEILYVDPLFEYPVAPEDITEFRDKCEWLVDNFWNPLDIKAKGSVDQAKLNHAFKVYSVACQYASKDKVTASVDRLYKSIQKNPTLLVQMTKAAEESIYGPRAEVWIDELYINILRSALAKKKFPNSRRAKYEMQLKQLESSLVGADPAHFDFKRPDGENARYFPMSTPTILIFGDPDCESCRMGILRMQSNVAFSKAVADGKINILFIIPDAEEGWEKGFADFPKSWTVGASDMVADVFDIRNVPQIYVVGSDGKIAAKNLSIPDAMQTTLNLISNNN